MTTIMGNPPNEAEMSKTETEVRPYVSIILAGGTWNTLLNIFKQFENDVMFRRADGQVELYTLDPSHVFMLRGKLSIACEGDGQGLIFVKDVLDFVKPFGKTTVLRYVFQNLGDSSCEVRVEAKGEIEGFKVFRREFTMPEPLSISCLPSAEASASIKNLKRLFNNIDSPHVDTVKLSMGEHALTLKTRDDEGVKQVSAPINTTNSDTGYYSGSILTKLVKSLPDTATTAKISILQNKSLMITVFLPQGYIELVMASRDGEDW